VVRKAARKYWERVRKKSVGFRGGHRIGNSALVLGVCLDPVKGVF
jgi:hypothetical protein